MEKIILFGASTMGKTAYKVLKDKYDIIYFTDNDKGKWGQKLFDLEIISPDRLMLLQYGLVVITSQYDLEIACQLLKLGIKQFGVYNSELNDIDYFSYVNVVGPFKQKNNKIALIKNNNSGSNTYALYKRMPDEIANKYEVVLIDKKIKENNYYWDLLESKLVVHTHTSDFYERQINVQLWHGFPLKTLSYMAKYPDDVKKQNNMYWNKLDVIASYSQTYNTFMNAGYGVSGEKYYITGMPRNDLLFTADGKRNLSELLGLSIKNKKTILYMPTFRETKYGLINGNTNSYNLLDFEDFSLEKFDSFLGELNSVLIIKPHPWGIENTYRHIKSLDLKNIVVLEDAHFEKCDLDLYEIINAVDLLITDYSSIYFDYLLLDRPIIFVPMDLKEYENNRGFLVEPYDFWAPGPKCYSLEQLGIEIVRCFNDNSYYQKERRTISNIVHHYKDAASSIRVWELLDNIMIKNGTLNDA